MVGCSDDSRRLNEAMERLGAEARENPSDIRGEGNDRRRQRRHCVTNGGIRPSPPFLFLSVLTRALRFFLFPRFVRSARRVYDARGSRKEEEEEGERGRYG